VTPTRTITLPTATHAALDDLADEHVRSKTDIVAALVLLAAAHRDEVAPALATITPGQPTRGTGRRAQAAAKRAAREAR